MKRFKKLLPIAVTLALVVSLLAMPMTALAAAMTGVSDTLSDYAYSATPSHTIAFTNIAAIPVAGTITITFPAGFDISTIVDADVTETVTSALSGALVVWAISGQDLVGTVSVEEITVGGQSVVIAATEIVSPSVAGTYTITIDTATSVPVAIDTGTCNVNITTSGTTAVAGNVPNVIEVAAPAGFTMPSLDPSAGTITSPEKNVNVSANGLSTWKLQAHEAAGGTDGKMTCTAPGAGTLAAVMKITTTGGEANVALSGSPATLWTAHAAGSDATVPVYFIQVVAYTDTVGSDYTITVTFTVGFNV